MNAMVEPIGFELPKKPRIKEQEPLPDQRKVVVLPFKAVFDERLTPGALQVLAALCAYCNRAGITWVSQNRLATELKTTRQAVTNQLAKLRAAGYVEIVRKGYTAQRTNTLRVIFDESITAQDAITMTSNKEDTRPPWLIEQEAMQAQEIDRAGQARIAKLISQALKQPSKQKEKTMPASGQTRTVKKMKEDINKAAAKRSKSSGQAVNNQENSGHSTVSSEAINGHSAVSSNTENIYREVLSKDKPKKELNLDLNKREDLRCVLGHDGLNVLTDAGLTDQDIEDGLATLLPIYQAEGLTPKPQHLVDGLMQMRRDAA
jgi:biotin operon repressor